MVTKYIIKKGDTFNGSLELFKNSSSEPPNKAEEFSLISQVKGLTEDFRDFVSFIYIAPGQWHFFADTSFWKLGLISWDIEVSLNGQVISIPHDTSMLIELRSGVTNAS